MNTILYFLEIVGISLFVSLAISGFVNYFGYRKSYENFGELSEQIFEKLGFEYPKEQDFYNEFLTDEGVQISVMKYRNKLKGQDPANSNMRCDSFKSHMIINKLSKFL